jgi:GNAT superfamily N-acetyltransferase
MEVSLFVMPEFRRQGVATVLASALLKWCLENDMDPHWDAANIELTNCPSGPSAP